MPKPLTPTAPRASRREREPSEARGAVGVRGLRGATASKTPGVSSRRAFLRPVEPAGHRSHEAGDATPPARFREAAQIVPPDQPPEE